MSVEAFRALLADADPEFTLDRGAGGASAEGTYEVSGWRTFVFFRAYCVGTFDENDRLIDKRVGGFD